MIKLVHFMVSWSTLGIFGEQCILRETSRYPYVVKIWRTAVIGHGALLNEYKVLSSCSAFSNLVDLKRDRYEMIVEDIGDDGKNLSTSCTAIRFAEKIEIHPECQQLNQSQLHDVAVWSLDSPFEVEGQPFLLLPPPRESKTLITIDLNETCTMVYTSDPTSRDSPPTIHETGRCGYENVTTLAICGGNHCPQQSSDSLLCFHTMQNDSWIVRQPGDQPDFIEGAVVLCNGTATGIAGRTFLSDEVQSYRMFSNVDDNLDFILNASSIQDNVMMEEITEMTGIPNTTWATETPFNCSCLPYSDVPDPLNSQTSPHIRNYIYMLGFMLFASHIPQLRRS